MRTTDGREARGERIELTVQAETVSSSVDPEKQLGLADITRLLHERIAVLSIEEPNARRIFRPTTDQLVVFGNPAHEDALWEHICPSCGNRTVHAVKVMVAYRNDDFRRNSVGVLYERYREEIATLDRVDIVLIPVGFCSYCQPGVSTPSLRLVARFPDVPDRRLDLKNADEGLCYLRNLASPRSTLSAWGCHALASWLGMDLNRAGKA